MNKITLDSPITRQPSLTSMEDGYIDKSLARCTGAGMITAGSFFGVGSLAALVYQVYPPAIVSGICCAGFSISGAELVSRSIKIEPCCQDLCIPKYSPDLPTTNETGIEMT